MFEYVVQFVLFTLTLRFNLRAGASSNQRHTFQWFKDATDLCFLNSFTLSISGGRRIS